MQDKLIPDGLKHLVRGYTDYAKEVVTDRAIPGIDGFKPSQRRILYTMKAIEKVKDNTKCANVAGAVMKLHPHGDAPIYQTMVRMIDSSECMNVSFIEGKGAFGKVYTQDSPAAARYTECRFAPIADELFGEMDGVEFVQSYDNKHVEPVLLPVSFPNVLCNTTQGIAVGVASNIPSFNFHELNNAVIEFINTGEIKEPLIPDFTTHGFYVKNEESLKELMVSGRARLKLRGKWFVEQKTIVINEIPYYSTVTEIMGNIKDIQGISDVRDESDKNGLRLAIECSSKKVVEDVLTQVIKVSGIQKTIMTNIVVIVDNKPVVIGVKELISRWVDFRSVVLTKTFTKELERVKENIENYEVIVELLSNASNRKKFLDALIIGEQQAKDFLAELFPKTKSFDYILSMSLKSLSNVKVKIKHLEGLKATKMQLEVDLSDVRKVIVRQLKELNAKYKFPRRTEVTSVDYVFEKDTQVVKAAPTPVMVLVNGKFIKKMRKTPVTSEISGALHCMSDDVLSFVDNKGRLLRVNLDVLDLVSEYDRGVYLSNYLEVEDDFEVVSYDVINGQKVGYIYSDGFASVLDYSEWSDAQRKTKITYNGVSDKSGLIIGEIDFTKQYLLLVTKRGKIGFVSTDFKQKHRTARTRIVDVKEDDSVYKVIPISYTNMMKLVSDTSRFIGKLVSVNKEDGFNRVLFEDLNS